ncbi:hypothetical protein J3R30DRAFT_1101213 [Lentinula aciculospora]|uniref:Uncharacterized protein n=1 Tax=Lentinula aciculospora TaxID=153920 RepID=A0A9W9A1T8_9AGAR|nr:hypothetical protein J3R30DRAFT_1101213 [Lentinula aciculospora]
MSRLSISLPNRIFYETMMNCPQRYRQKGPTSLISRVRREDENIVSVPDAFSCNYRHLNTSPPLQHEPDRVQPFAHAYSFNTCTPHVYSTSKNNTNQNLEMSPSRYRPRQSIPSDVSSPSSYVGNENALKRRQGQPCKQENSQTADEALTEQANRSNLTKIHAIDPACLRSIVRFDYACLEDLDEELILRPRSAFAELCWSTAVQSLSPSNESSSSAKSFQSCSTSDVSQSAVRGSNSGKPSTPPQTYSNPLMLAKVVEGFSAAGEDSHSESHSGSESDRCPSPTWHDSVEESAVMVVTGRRSLNVLEDHVGMKLFERKSSAGTFVVPSESFIPVASTYRYHDHLDDSRLDTSRYRDDDHENECSQLTSLDFHNKKGFNADTESLISFRKDDTNTIPEAHTLPSLITYTFPHADALLYSNLNAYAGVANPQESIGFFPIPTVGSRTTADRQGRRCKSRLSGKSGSFGSSVSKFCRAIFPLSGQIPKR